jgi:hypothetical protein
MKTSSLERKDPDVFWPRLHTYHCASFTRECHGTATLQAQTTSIYDVIGHR